MWNCTDLDAFVSDVHAVANGGDVGVVVAVATLCIFGGFLVIAGEQMVRPLGVVVAGLGGAWATLLLTAAIGNLACEGRLIAAGVVGVVAGAFAWCLLRTAVFVIGAGGLAALTHLTYDSLPLPAPGNDFVLLGRSGYYFVAMLAAVVVGGVASYVQRRNVLVVASSLLGGGCFALALFIVCDRQGVALPSAVGLGVLIALACVGTGVQRWRRRRRIRRRRHTTTDGSRGTASPVRRLKR